MNRHGPRRKGLPASQVLTYNDLLFINEYLANGQNGTRAYMSVHPKATIRTAGQEAQRVLQKPAVAEHLNYRARAAGITPELLQSRLEWCYEEARKLGDPSIAASVAMDQAKLAGLLVDKREVKTVDDGDKSALRRLIDPAIGAS